MSERTTIRAQYMQEVGHREEHLLRARECAKLTKPWVLPPKAHAKDSRLPENYQSLGARGITNLEGKMILALYPPDMPWFQLVPAAEIRYDPNVPPEDIQEIERRLHLYELIVQAKLEAAVYGTHGRRPIGFRTNKRQSLSLILITGESMERINRDYTITVLTRDQYTVTRDSAGNILSIKIEEKIDPLTLTAEQLEKSELDVGELRRKSAAERQRPIYTQAEWDVEKKKWIIKQELNDRIVNDSEEPVSPFVSTPLELAPNANYGVGFVEANRGDLFSYNSLSEKTLDFAALASKMVPILDPSSMIKPEHLERKSGVPVVDHVANGVWQRGCFMSVDKLSDFSIVNAVMQRTEGRLGKGMLLESESVRKSERTTAFEIQATTIRELDGALGGLYAPTADSNQIPTIQRVMYMLQEDGVLPPLPKGAVEIKALTGIAALARQAAAGRIKELVADVAALGPQALAKINLDILVDVLYRYQSIYEPGLIKTKAELAQELRDAIAAQTAAAAGEKAVDVAGNIVEQQASQETVNV